MRAGFARADITCAPGTPLGGNARHDKAARGVHDPLFATVAVLAGDEDAALPVILVGCDLLAAPASLVLAFTDAIGRSTGIPPSRVIVSASHTHSGPDVTRGLGFEDHDFSLVDEWMIPAASAVGLAAAAALATLAPATISMLRTTVAGVAFNRRLALTSGETRMNWEPVDPAEVVGALGPVDEQLLLLRFAGADGAFVGAIIHFTLHPAVLVGYEWLVSADWVAPMSDRVAEELGGVPVLFLNGALGNINHLDYADSGRAIGFAETERIGSRIADALATAGPEPVDAAAPALDRFTLTVPQRTVAAEAIERAARLIEANAGAPIDALDGIPETAYAYWTLDRGVHLAPTLDVPVGILQLGSVTLVFLPFEVFVEFGLWLSAALPNRIVRIVSLANDYLGYLPTEAAFAEGGYEPTLGTSTIVPGAGELILEAVAERLAGTSWRAP